MRPSLAFSKPNGRAHCGIQAEGGYLYTLTLTDIATGWTECLPLLYRSRETVLAAFQRAQTLFPFPIFGIDTDNGGEFLNEEVVAYCKREQITFTRGRPYQKRDQCFVEQKMERLCVRSWATIASLENRLIGNSPNSIGHCVCMSTVFNPR
jgi:Integrase core domain